MQREIVSQQKNEGAGSSEAGRFVGFYVATGISACLVVFAAILYNLLLLQSTSVTQSDTQNSTTSFVLLRLIIVENHSNVITLTAGLNLQGVLLILAIIVIVACYHHLFHIVLPWFRQSIQRTDSQVKDGE